MKLKHSEWRSVVAYFEMGSGTVLDFSNRTFAEFFDDELQIDIYDDAYGLGGNSKAKRLRSFIKLSSPRQAGRVLRALWECKKSDVRQAFERRLAVAHLADGLELLDVEMQFDAQEDEEFEYFVGKIENRDQDEVINAASILATEFDLDTVQTDIERARNFVQDDPEDAITAACSLLESLCRSILIELDEELPKDKSIQPLYRRVAKVLNLAAGRDDIDSLILNDVRKVLSGLSTLIEGIGALRTHAGDAHGKNQGTKRVDARIAKLAVNSASGVAIFLIETWERSYPERKLRNSE